MNPSRQNFLIWSLAVFSLFAILFYAYVHVMAAPYLGFTISPVEGKISDVVTADGLLREGDIVLQVEGQLWKTYSSDLSNPLLSEFTRRPSIHLLIERDNQVLDVVWPVSGPLPSLILNRLLNQWLVGLVFWISGMFALLVIRPRDARWLLLATFYFLMGSWIAVGGSSAFRLWYSAVLYRAITWPLLVVALHFHWKFPVSLSRLPRWLLWIAYTLSFGMALAEIFQLTSPLAYQVGVLLLLVGSVLLLVTHAARQPSTRLDLRLLVMAFTIIVLLIFILTWLSDLTDYPAYSYLAIPILSIIPLSYFTITYRNQPGGMEMRANNLITYMFFVLGLTTLVLAGVSVLIYVTADIKLDLLLGILWLLIMGLSGNLFYRRFQRWFERRVLNVHIPSDELVAAHARQVLISPDREHLSATLTRQVFPSLFIRQAAVLELIDPDEHGIPHRVQPVALLGVTFEQLPQPAAIPSLIQNAGQSQALPAVSWVRLALPLEYHGRPVGVCLLGRRDPNDSYASAELSILQTLMDQTALALVNTGQAELIHALQRYEIEQQEEALRSLAHDLHDDLLGQMTLVSQHVDPNNEPFRQAQQAAVQHVRDIISGLRPSTLAIFGLYPALDELLDELDGFARQTGQPELPITLQVPSSDARYPTEVELAVYRIVQQACRNAIKHAQGQRVAICGVLEPGRINLYVEDDGKGFAAFARSELTPMLLHKHFGLLNMYERADLIDACLEFDSIPGQGTRVRIIWPG